MANGRILVVDDEESLCEILQFNLESEGYEVTTANSAEEALRLDIKSYDLILLDVMMGEMSGTRMASLLKADPETAHVPIIFCTARDCEDDRVSGLELGADDYIAKPFSVRELVARVKSVLRRTRHDDEAEDRIVYEGLCIDCRRKVCTMDGEPVQLTKKELEILMLLLSNRGRIFSREQILQSVWSDKVIVLDRTIDVNITRLRRKIGRYGDRIVTRQGYGYGFEA
ncbi:MAG: response regulator transcription factor [Alistipes sp.]|nr:response regulator transcription factor [Alistipes sp.]